MKRALVALVLLLPLLSLTSLSAAAAPSTPTAKYVCLIVLDGGRPDYITNRLNQLPHVKAFMQHARWYNNAWVGNLMSITPPDHAVIGTGSLPKDDGGIVNWDWGIHSTGHISPTLQNAANFNNGYAFKLMKQSGTPTLAGRIHAKYPKSVVIAGSAAHFHAAGPMGGPDANWIFWFQATQGHWRIEPLGTKPVPAKIMHDRQLSVPLATSNGSTVPLYYDRLPLGQSDSLVVTTAIKALKLYKPRGIFINLSETDTIGHWSHQWKRDEGILYRAFDKDLVRLIHAYKAAGIYKQTLFVVTADHGMIQSKSRVLDHVAVVDQIKSMLGKSSIILTNGGGSAGPTMTSIWLKNPANNAKTAKAIWAKHYDNVSAIYYMTHTNGQYAYKMAGCEGATSPATQCSPGLQKAYDYLLGTEAGPTGEDIAILLRENSRNSGLPQMLGRHGGADWGSQHITLMFSGPGVKTGTSNAPARLADIAPTIERFMGMAPDARDGFVLADAFQNPNAADVAKQNTMDQTFLPMVNALKQRATSDIKLEAAGKIPNYVPSNEIIIHWKRRLAVTIAGAVVFLGAIVFLGWAIFEVRRQGTGLTWTE